MNIKFKRILVLLFNKDIRKYFKKQTVKRLNLRQRQYLALMRKFLYDPNSKVYMSPDSERYIENYDFMEKTPTYFIYITDGGTKTRIPGFSGMEIKNHNDHFMEYYDDKQMEQIYIEIDKEIRNRRIKMYDFATQNIINRLKELSE